MACSALVMFCMVLLWCGQQAFLLFDNLDSYGKAVWDEWFVCPL